MTALLSIIRLHSALEEEKLAHQFAEKRVAELEETNRNNMACANAERDALKARIAELEDVLKWYASWFGNDDNGQRARVALEKKDI